MSAPVKRSAKKKKSIDRRDPAIRVMLLPRDTNGNGTIFGGVILSYIDLAGAVEARKHTRARVVTVAMDQVVFKEPVFVGDLLSLYTLVEKHGRTSLTIAVTVEAERERERGRLVLVTQAKVVYVAIDEAGRSVPLRDT